MNVEAMVGGGFGDISLFVAGSGIKMGSHS